MTDNCSHLWHLTDAELLSHFDFHYPQTESWRLVHPSPAMLSSVTCALRRQRPKLESFLREPPPTTMPGRSGPTFATISSSTLSSLETVTPSFSYKSLPNATKQASLLPMAGLSSLARWKAPSVRWDRPLQRGGQRPLADHSWNYGVSPWPPITRLRLSRSSA
jgi:hypothetical protein